jgi:hypothetical protein
VTALRPLRTEIRRGTVLTVLLCAATQAVILSQWAPYWGARWQGLGTSFRVGLLALCPLVATAAAWHAGRDQRCGTTELLATMSRPPWQRVTLAWAAVTLSALSGAAMALAVAAALIAPRATYSGDAWWALLPTGALGVGTTAAAGLMLGRLWPYRLTAPLVGVLIFAVLSASVALGDMQGTEWLSPALQSPAEWYRDRLDASTHLWQALWFVALTVTFLLLAGTRRRLRALLPLAVAAVAAVPLVGAPEWDRWKPDAAAREPVCRAVGNSARVCLTRVNAFAADEMTTAIGPVVARLGGMAGTPVTVTDSLVPPPGWLHVGLDLVDARGHLRDPSSLRYRVASALGPNCAGVGIAEMEEWMRLGDTAGALVLGEPEAFTGDKGTEQLLGHLRARPGHVQRAWIAQYMAARSRCDDATAQKLLRP